MKKWKIKYENFNKTNFLFFSKSKPVIFILIIHSATTNLSGTTDSWLIWGVCILVHLALCKSVIFFFMSIAFNVVFLTVIQILITDSYIMWPKIFQNRFINVIWIALEKQWWTLRFNSKFAHAFLVQKWYVAIFRIKVHVLRIIWLAKRNHTKFEIVWVYFTIGRERIF